MKYITLITLFVCLGIIACSDDDNDTILVCEQQLTIDAQKYQDTTTDVVTITDLNIMDDCLLINYSASGCDGSSWMLDLIDSEVVLESLPTQRNLRLTLINNEACLAVLSKETSFDISNLQTEEGAVQLNFPEMELSIVYEY